MCPDSSAVFAAPAPLPSRHAQRPAPLAAGASGFEVRWANSEAEVRLAQRLRYQVFVQEMGARLSPPAGTPAGLDADRFDPFCDHLLVYVATGESPDRWPLVGTYRVLAPFAARRAGGFYTDTEFDLAPVARLRPRAVELGRSCVHPAWRSGAVIMALWTALGRYMVERRLDTMIGCASIALDDGGRTAGALWQRLRDTHLAAPQWQVRPRIPLPLPADGAARMDNRQPGWKLEVPPLVKGYLRCGARVLGPPALDIAFNTADLPVMLRIGELTPRYRKRFLGA